MVYFLTVLIFIVPILSFQENLAFTKPTYQFSGQYNNANSGKAVDGDSNGDFKGGYGSCTLTYSTSSEQAWWRVDLGQDELVSEVYVVNRLDSDCQCGNRLNNFEIRVGTVSSMSDSSMTNPRCGGSHSVPVSEGASFFCHPSLKGRYVTIRDLRQPQVNQQFTLCEVEVYSERRACHMQTIGLASSDAFPDSSFSASTQFDNRYAPSNGRLNGERVWAPLGNDNPNDYLQIDLLYEYAICAVATQGAAKNDEWTTKYKLQLSLDGNNFVTYQENNLDKEFNGNSGRNDIVKHRLKEYASAVSIRFLPTAYSGYKALRVEVYGVILSAVPSQAPSNFMVTPISSTSIRASWALLPEYARHGTIKGYKLFYKNKGSAESATLVPINNGATLTKNVTGLDEYTEYEFQVLAFTSGGDGPKSSVEIEWTLEDAPSIPANLFYTEISPSDSHGPRISLAWNKPAEANGIIRSYTVLYSNNQEPHNVHTETLGADVFSYTVDVLGGVQYQFHVRAVTIKPGPNATETVTTKEYEPSVGPDDVSFTELNRTTFNISWSPLTREKSYGKVISYEVKAELLSAGRRRKRSPANSKTVDTTAAFVIMHGIHRCYNVSVRAYTKAGSGPFSQPLSLDKSRSQAPSDLKATKSETTEITLEWKEPQLAVEENVNYIVKYSGTKSYNTSFAHEGTKDVKDATTYTVENLVPGTKYKFEVYRISVCGNKGSSASFDEETKMEAPVAPVVLKLTNVRISESLAEIDLWPAEQRNGPISAYQVIVLKVTDCVQELPKDYNLKLKDLNENNLNFYVAAEIENDPVYGTSWKFTVGDGKSYGTFVNKGLKRGEDYIVYQRATTNHQGQILEGRISKVATISVTPEPPSTTKDTVKGDESQHQVLLAAVVALSCTVFVLLIVIGALIWRLRRVVSSNKTTTVDNGITDTVSPGNPQVSEPGVYMELHPSPSQGQSRAPEYQSLQDSHMTLDYYNVGFKRGISEKKDEGDYEIAQS